MTGPQAGLSRLLRDLESPLEQVRQAALEGLERFPALSKLRALRRVAATDPSVTLRLEARRQLDAAVRELSAAELGRDGGVDVPVERLQALLGAPEPGLRVKAIRGLAVSEDPRVPALLAEVLGREREPFVLAAALQALAAAAGRAATASIFPYLSESDARLRATAVEALEATGDPTALPHLLPLLEDPHHRVRAMAARAVQAHDPEAVLACVDAMMADPQEMTVRSAAFVLRFFQEATALPRLRERLADVRPGVVAMALASLTHMARSGSVRATQLLARVRAGDSAPVPSGMEPAESPVAAPLEDRLSAPDAAVRLSAVREAVSNGREDLMDRVRLLLEHEGDPRVLATAVAATGLLGTGEDVRFVRPYLAHPDARLRANAVEAVGVLSRVRKIRLLTPHLTDPNNRVRANAAVALHGAEGIDVMPVLREMASSHDRRHAVSAVWAAATIATPGAVQVLAGLLASADADVAARAKKALAEMAPVQAEARAVLATWNAAAPAETAPEPEPAPAPAAPPDAELERALFDLRHESPSVRQDAARKLSARGDPGLLVHVRPLLRDDDPSVRRAAREAARALVSRVAPGKASPAQLGKFEEELARGPEAARRALDGVLDVAVRCGMAATAEAIVARLPEERAPFVRAGLVSALALIGERSAVPLLEELTRDPDARVRANAVDALEMLGGGQDARAAIERLSDPDPRVRAAAITASLSLYREPFLSHLRGMLACQTVAERAAGLYALQAVLIPERAELLRGYLLAETQPRLYESAADALVKELSGNVEALEKLAAELPEGDKRRHLERCVKRLVEGWVAPAPADVAATQSFETLTELSHLLDLKKLGQLSPEVMRQELSRERDALAVSFLLEEAADARVADFVELAQPFTHSKDRRIRLAAVEALGKLGTPEASEAIAFLVRDRDPEISRRAMERLEKLSPESAQAGIRSLLETAHSWAVKRGLELLERRGDPAALPVALSALSLGGDPALVEPLTRLVRAWGTEATLDDLARLYREAAPPDRPLLRELGAAVVQERALAAELLDRHFPAELPPAPAPAPQTMRLAVSRAARSRALTRAPLPRAPQERDGWSGFQLAAALGTMLLVLVVITAVNRPGQAPAAPEGRLITNETAEPRRIEMAVASAAPVLDAPAATSAGGELAAPPPALADVKAALKRAFAGKGIRSDAILQLMALDRFQTGYRGDIARARDAAALGRHQEALQILDGALASVEPDHTVARLLILRASEVIARGAGRFDLLPKLRELLAKEQKALIAALQKAARDGDIPEDKLKAVLAKMEAQEKERAVTRRGSDWLSGADMTQGPLEPLGEN